MIVDSITNIIDSIYLPFFIIGIFGWLLLIKSHLHDRSILGLSAIVLFMIGWRLMIGMKSSRYSLILLYPFCFFSFYALNQMPVFFRQKYGIRVGRLCVIFNILFICLLSLPRYLKSYSEHQIFRNLCEELQEETFVNGDTIWLVPRDGGRFAYYAGVPRANVLSQDFDKIFVPVYRKSVVFALVKTNNRELDNFIKEKTLRKEWRINNRKSFQLYEVEPLNKVMEFDKASFAIVDNELIENGSFDAYQQNNLYPSCFFDYSPWKQENGIKPVCEVTDKNPVSGKYSLHISVSAYSSRFQLLTKKLYSCKRKYLFSFSAKGTKDTAFYICSWNADSKGNYKNRNMYQTYVFNKDETLTFSTVMDLRTSDCLQFRPTIMVTNGDMVIDNMSMHEI